MIPQRVGTPVLDEVSKIISDIVEQFSSQISEGSVCISMHGAVLTEFLFYLRRAQYANALWTPLAGDNM